MYSHDAQHFETAESLSPDQPSKAAHLGEAASQYVRNGLSLIAIPLGLKGPREKGWQRKENVICDPDRAAELSRCNIGLAHRWSGTCAIDVDDYQRAREWLGDRGVNIQTLLAADDAVQIRSGKPNRAKLLYRLPADVDWLPTLQPDGSGLELRCANRDGTTTVQDVLPPSVHPDTGAPYEWAGTGCWQNLPTLPKAVLTLWHSPANSEASVRTPVLAGDTSVIVQGGRNTYLTSVAGTMRRRGMDQSAIAVALAAENASKCQPPLGCDEVRGIAASVSRYTPAQHAPDDWPELVSLDSPNLPALDPACLPGWAGEYARALSLHTETPFELAAGMILIACATAASRRIRVMVGPGYFEPCNLWTVVALPPGNRKSAVQSAATAPLLAWERDQNEIIAPEIKRLTSELKTLEARAKDKRSRAAREKDARKAEAFAREAAEIEGDLPQIPVPPRLWTSDATPEQLGPTLATHGECLGWLSSEGGIFDLLQGRYSNGIPNLDLVLKAHSGDPERVDRGSRPAVYLRSPRLCIGLSPQPDVLRGLAAKPGFRGRGLLARFLYLLPASPLGFRKLQATAIPEGVRNAYSAGIRAMLDSPIAIDEHGEERPHLIRLSSEAHGEWLAFALAVEMQMQPGRELEHFTDWAGKAPGAAARLAGVLHAIKHAHGEPWNAVVTVETMTDALEIMAVISRHSLAALDMMGADPTVAAARVVWKWVERNRLSDFRIRDAFNALRGTFPRVSNLQQALAVLEERGYIEISEPLPVGPGRPQSPTVYVRPDIVGSWS